MEIKMHNWSIAEMIGYEPKTTFWQDFEIANVFGKESVKDTFIRAFKDCKNDYIYLTELVLVLNHQSWLQYDLRNQELCELYTDLFEKARSYAYKNLNGDELSYYFRVTD